MHTKKTAIWIECNWNTVFLFKKAFIIFINIHINILFCFFFVVAGIHIMCTRFDNMNGNMHAQSYCQLVPAGSDIFKHQNNYLCMNRFMTAQYSLLSIYKYFVQKSNLKIPSVVIQTSVCMYTCTQASLQSCISDDLMFIFTSRLESLVWVLKFLNIARVTMAISSLSYRYDGEADYVNGYCTCILLQWFPSSVPVLTSCECWVSFQPRMQF